MKDEKKLKFDKEYSTCFLRELRYLESNGIKPTFKKNIDGVDFYKFEKTPLLFEMLRKFYESK